MLSSRFPTWVITLHAGNPVEASGFPGVNSVYECLHKKCILPIDKIDLIRYIIRELKQGVYKKMMEKFGEDVIERKFYVSFG